MEQTSEAFQTAEWQVAFRTGVVPVDQSVACIFLKLEGVQLTIWCSKQVQLCSWPRWVGGHIRGWLPWSPSVSWWRGLVVWLKPAPEPTQKKSSVTISSLTRTRLTCAPVPSHRCIMMSHLSRTLTPSPERSQQHYNMLSVRLMAVACSYVKLGLLDSFSPLEVIIVHCVDWELE